MTFPDKLSKSRPVYFAMDHTSSKDQTICNTVVNALKAGGLNVVRSKIGPNELYGNMLYVYNQGLTNAIVINLFNGVDPANIREVGINGNDNRGRTFRSRGNDVILAWFYDSCDFTRPDGSCYESVRDSETHTGRLYNPLQYSQEQKIYVVNQSSNSHQNPERADYTGEKVAAAILNLFSSGEDPTPQDTSPETTPTTTTTDNTKTIVSKVITKEYTSPFYEKVYKLKTDHNGSFNLLHSLPYKGEYNVSIHYGGNKTHASTSKTVTINNYSDNSSIFHEELLRTITTVKYSDNTVKTEEVGKKPDTKHLKRVITTETYENNKVKETTTKILYMDDILKEKTQELTPTEIEDDDYEDYEDNDEDYTLGNVGDPFVNKIPPKNDGTPNIALMSTNNKKYVMVNTSRSYTLTKEQYRAVMQRDSQTLQINGYQTSAYTAFESTDTNTYNVVSREQWNAIEECILYYLVADSNRVYPGTVKIDYPNNRVVCNSTNVSFKNGTECLIHIVGDDQKWGYTCGPTSCSVCTQVLHNYYSEKQLKEAGGVYSTTGPEKLVKGLNKYEFKATQVSTNKTTALAELVAGRPTVWHFSGHYICFATRNNGNSKILVANSATSSKYTQYGKSTTGWHNPSDIVGAYGGTVTVKLNWLLSSDEEASLRNYLECMGGTWDRPDTSESIRRPRE